MIKVLELFAGYGGASFALKKLGIDHEVVGFSEIDKYAIQCWKQNHSDVKNYGDCTKINANELPDFDLLTGGFPCQSFSNAGNMKGELDTRGTLVYDIIRIAEVKQPRYLLLENVKGFTFKKFKETFNKVLSELDRIGYNVYWEVLNSKEYGTPQNRERVWFVCFRKDIDQYNKLTNPFIFPKKKELKLFLKDILEDNPDYKYNLTESNIKTINRNFGSKGKVIDMSQDLSIIEKMTYPKRINQTQATLSPTLTTAMGTGGGNVPVIQMTKSGYETNDSKPGIGQANRVYGVAGVSPPLNVTWTPKISEKYYLSEEQVNKIKYSNFNQLKTRIQDGEICQTILSRDYKDPKCVEVKSKVICINPYNGKTSTTETGTIGTSVGSTTGMTAQLLIQEQTINKVYPTIKVGGDIKCIKDHKSYISWEDSKGRFNTQDHRAFKEDMYSGTVPAMERGIPNVYEKYINVRKLTPKECFRLMGFFEDEINLKGIKITKVLKTCRKYINLWETKLNVKCLLAKETHKQRNMETFASFTIKENIKQEQQGKHTELGLPETLNVDIVIKKLEKQEREVCAINTIKCGEITTEMLYTLIKENLDLNLQDTQDVSVVVQHTKLLWKITLKDLCKKGKLFIISMVTNLIIQSQIFTCVKAEANILTSIDSWNMSPCNLLEVDISNLKMEYMSSPLSDSQCYKLAGNGWDINVVSKILEKMLKNENIKLINSKDDNIIK